MAADENRQPGSPTAGEQQEWDDAEAQFNQLLEERQRLASVLELEQMKQQLLLGVSAAPPARLALARVLILPGTDHATQAGTAPAVRSAWTEESKRPLESSESMAQLNAADARMAALLAEEEVQDENDYGRLSQADQERLARLMGADDDDAGEAADGDNLPDDPEELRRMMESMEAQLQELTMAKAIQEEELELRTLKATLQQEKLALAESRYDMLSHMDSTPGKSSF